MATPSNTTMQYLATKQNGPFTTATVPQHTLGPNEVLVALKAIGLNPIDWKQHSFGFFVPSWPVLFGNEGGGTVAAVGSTVQHFQPGDRVVAHCISGNPRAAAFQTFAALDSSRLAKLPDAMSFEDAASLPVGYTTAVAAVHQSLNIPNPSLPTTASPAPNSPTLSPSTILVCGGSSTVGSSALQLLRHALPSAQILTTASPKHHAHLKSLGADLAFDQSSPTLIASLKSSTPHGSGVDAILDAVGGVATNPALLALLTGPKAFAEVATGANLDPATIPADVAHALVRSETVYAQAGGAQLSAALEAMLADGSYRPGVAVKVVGNGLESVGRALEELKAGVSGTKLVVTL